MSWNFTPLSLLYLLAAFINLATTFINWVRYSSRRGTRTLSVTLMCVGVWLLGGFIETSVVEPVYKYYALVAEDMLSVAYSVLVFYFIMDYFNILAWFRPWRRFLWIPVVLNVLLDLTNRIHHWFWTYPTPGPAGSNVIFFEHGPLYAAVNYYFLLLPLASILLLISHSLKSTGWERWLARYIILSLASPYAAYLLFASSPSDLSGFEALPVGYAFSALMIGWSVLEDYRRTDRERTIELEGSIHELKQEIQKREQLELNLRQAHEVLSFQLAEQSTKLSGLYDLILVPSQAADESELLHNSLAKISTVLNCQAIIHYYLDRNLKLQFGAVKGPLFDPEKIIQSIRSDWLPVTADVRAEMSMRDAADIPVNLHPAENAAALFRWVIVQNHPIGLLAAYWGEGYRFSVEEIAMFGACCDGLGLILENARLRQNIADNAIVKERRRLARDLHDSVTQSLNSLVLSSQTALDENISAERLKRVLTRLDVSARQALKEMRLLLYEMRLASPSETGLLELLGNRLDAVERRAGIQAELLVSEDAAWPREWEAQLYPLAMEALNNALKHARASSVSLSFSGSWQNLQMEIRDNGRGFDPQSLQSAGMGLKNMAERCELLGARLEIISGFASGTSVRVKMLDNSAVAPRKEAANE